MNPKISTLLTALFLLAGANAYAQNNRLAEKSLKALTGQVHSAFSTTAPLSVQSVNMLGRKIAAAQFTLKTSAYISSAELFKRVRTSRALENVKPAEAQLLEQKFNQLDAVAMTRPVGGYVGALWEMSPATDPEVLADTNVYAMTDLLNIQQYMQSHENMFPEIYYILEGGWLTASSCLDSPEGNQAFLGVVSILTKEQTGAVSPAVVEQLVALHAHANNTPRVQDVVNGLKEWRKANHSDDAPKLPTDMEGLSLRNNPETLWLTTEIRLLQLTPDENIPEIIKTAKVTK